MFMTIHIFINITVVSIFYIQVKNITQSFIKNADDTDTLLNDEVITVY